MKSFSRRGFLDLALAAPAGLASAMAGASDLAAGSVDVHERILELAARQETKRRESFARVQSRAELVALQSSLRQTVLGLLDGLPQSAGVPPAQRTGMIEADDYTIEKLVFQSYPGYFVSALLYKPKKISSRVPGVLSPCGHSTNGKAAAGYQILHVNLAKRGYVVLTYDPVGQGERSQFWDEARGRSRFNLSCGEHAVLGNPLYLLGTSLARFRISDGMRGLDYLVSLPEVDPTRIGCVGNSGGGTLTAYIAALDPRISVAAICCYITTLRRRMGNRIQEDPSADPEQDIFGFVSGGIDHAGLLALLAPRPTLLGTARFDFFPIEGARETFAEARRLYEIAGAGNRIERVEAAARHGLSTPIRQAVYDWFDRWLARDPRGAPVAEVAVPPRREKELLVCADGQVNRTFRSRPFFELALEEFERKPRPPRLDLRTLLGLESDQGDPLITEIKPGSKTARTAVVCVNGNEARDWRLEEAFLDELSRCGHAALVIDPRGVGPRRAQLTIPGRDYADPLDGVEENIAYNAFLVGKSLLGMRVADVLAAVRKLATEQGDRRLVVCGRRDAALVACLAAAVEPAIVQVACEDMLLSFRALFSAQGYPINAASILPGLLQRFGDIPEILAQIAPRKLLVAAGMSSATSVAVRSANGRPSAVNEGKTAIGRSFAARTTTNGAQPRAAPAVNRFTQFVPERFSKSPRVLTDWLGDR